MIPDNILSKYKIVLDESYQHDTPDMRKEIWWYQQIACKSGALIYLHALEPLVFALYVPTRQRAVNLIIMFNTKNISYMCEKTDYEGVIYFKGEDLDQVCKIAGARRKRKLSEEQKQKNIERLKAYQFKSQNDASK